MRARTNPMTNGTDETRMMEGAQAPGAAGAGEVREIALDAIEPDPAQPRRAFDEAKLQSLAASIARYGLLQEPGVVPLPPGGGAEARYRLVWGERRWRAIRIAGLTTIRCKVLPPADDSAVEQLRTKEKQWAENMEREGLSAIEEAMAIQDAVDVERKLDGDTPVGDLVEKVGTARGLNGMVARNLVALLKTPRCLQSAVLARSIGREVAFELTRHWNKMLAEHELHGAAKRAIQFRNLVEAWARSRGAELDAQAMAAFAAETFQDPKAVKATCLKAETAQGKLVDRFAAVVERAQKEGWTVAKAREAHRERRRTARAVRKLPCLERAGKDNARVTVHLDRLRAAAGTSPESIAEALGVLRAIVGEIEAAGAAAASTVELDAADARTRPASTSPARSGAESSAASVGGGAARTEGRHSTVSGESVRRTTTP
ncbi:putative chromosome-partitioning protein ParB [Anaeromyxobacter sp. PSR-1]|nr:putative chromosome-partitioning protein ParB [Anaeromyxobacter sp. PSR-1]